MTTLPKNLRDALPNQPDAVVTVAGPITPGTGATDLGKAEGQTFVAGDVGVEGLAVVDDGTVEFPASGKYAPPRLDPETRGLVVGPQIGAAPSGLEHGIIPLFIGNGLNGPVWIPVTLEPTSGALPIYCPVGNIPVSGSIAIAGNVAVAIVGVSGQLGPYTTGESFTSVQADALMKSLSAAVTCDGTVASYNMVFTVLDIFGNESAPLATLTQATLGVLQPIVVGFPFLFVKATVNTLVFGTGTALTVSYQATQS